MNKFPAWLNLLVLAILAAGCLFALPNIYGSVEAVQVADNDGTEYEASDVDRFVAVVEGTGVTPEAAYLRDGRVVIRFDNSEDQDDRTDQATEDGRFTHRAMHVTEKRIPPTNISSLNLHAVGGA